ncbi:MAG TPA: extracellular solute-binding protein, partial [Spirochaetia bacterium]|nr:extracellular solute-binding protein [Spirochaetia bacterium]
IDLQMEILFNQPYHEKLGAYIAAGNIPDVIYTWPSNRSSSAILHQMHLLKDLTPLLGKQFLANFVAPAIDPKAQPSGYLAELPQSITYTTVVYANKKLLADNGFDLPKTYADLKKMVAPLKAKGIQVITLPDVDGWQMQSCLFSTVVGRMLGNAWVDQVKKGTAKFTDPGYVAALTFIDTMFKDGVIPRADMQLGYGDGPTLFATGKAAMIIDGDWRTGFYITDKTTGKALIPPEQQASDYAFINFPAIPGEKFPGVVSAIQGVGLGISASIPRGSDVEKAAVRLLKYYYSPEVQKIKLETGAFIPALKGVTSESVDPFISMMPKYYAGINKISYVLDGVLDPGVCNNYVNKGLQDIGLGNKTPRQVAAETEKAMADWRASQ